MKSKKLKFQIFLYMAIELVVWFFITSGLYEILYYLEDKRGVDFPFKFYLFVNCIQLLLLVIMNIPFVRFLIKRVDKPVKKIISGLNQISEGNYSEKIDFSAQNELDEIKTAFNDMAKKLEEAENVKRNAENERILLFANMAHDLKTPITSIIGFSKALSDGIIEDEEKKKEYFTTINRKAVKMNALIDRLFEYVKLESGDNQLHFEMIDAAELLRNCLADVYTEYEEKNILLELEIPELPVMKKVDKVELSRVYANLLNNVIKHNSDGIRVLVRMETNGNVMIADSGLPLAENLAEKLFTPFVSGDSSRRSSNGSGLGLALARKIMEKHGGSLIFIQNDNQNDEKLPPEYTKAFIADL